MNTRSFVWALLSVVASPIYLFSASSEKEATSKSIVSASSLPIKDANPLSAPPNGQAISLEEHLRAAEAFKLRSKDPSIGSIEAKKFKAKEAIALLRAAHTGDKKNNSRRRQLVSEVRIDKSIPSALRYQVAATADNQEIDLTKSHKEIMAAFAANARQHAREFPDLPQAYESLVHIAEDTPDDSLSKSLAKEVLASSAPELIKKQARSLLERHKLVGQSADNFFDEAIRTKTKGKSFIVYTWSSEVPRSIAFAKKLQKQAPEATILIGINLDKDVSKARKLALEEKLPGEQRFNSDGTGGKLAQKLMLRTPHKAYMIDGSGRVRSVSIGNDVVEKLAKSSGQ